MAKELTKEQRKEIKEKSLLLTGTRLSIVKILAKEYGVSISTTRKYIDEKFKSNLKYMPVLPDEAESIRKAFNECEGKNESEKIKIVALNFSRSEYKVRQIIKQAESDNNQIEAEKYFNYKMEQF